MADQIQVEMGINVDGIAAFPLLDIALLPVLTNVFVDIEEKIRTELLPAGSPESFAARMVKLVKYNISGGKCIRLQMAVAAFQHFSPDASSADVSLACALGWICEIVHGVAIAIDDYLDSGTLRRGLPCYYRLPDVGRNFILDTHSMLQVCDMLLESYFKEKPYYSKLTALYNEMKWISLVGEDMDSRLTPEMRLQEFSESLYRTICNYKTSHYTFYFPIAAALSMMPGYNLEDEFVRRAGYLLGYLFQIQDDFLDVYGEELVMGKIGSDIQEGKCTWLIVSALEHADLYQKEILTKHYGSGSEHDVQLVKQVFDQVGVKSIGAQQFKATAEAEFNQLLAAMPETAPVSLYRQLFQVLANRQN